MPRPRLLACLARLVLAWFALHVGLGIAAPLVQPQDLQMVCAGGGGMKVVLDGEEAGAAAALDCPLCSPFVALPPPVVALAVVPAARQGVAHRQAARHVPPAQAPPARAPPVPSVR